MLSAAQHSGAISGYGGEEVSVLYQGSLCRLLVFLLRLEDGPFLSSIPSQRGHFHNTEAHGLRGGKEPPISRNEATVERAT